VAIADLVANIRANIAGFTGPLNEAQRQMRNTAERVQEAGTTMGVALGAAGAAIGIALGSAVVKAADFEAQIDRVGAIAGASGKDFDRLRQAALDLGASTSKSATEVAVGMEQMAAAGFETNEIIAAMPGVIAAAEASGEDMARVTEVVTAALNSFGLEASEATRVADIMAMAANQSAASVDDMGYAFKYAGPVAKQLGFDIEWLAAAVGVMADAGLEGSQAGTTLRMALSRLAKDTGPAAKAIKQIGVDMTDANGKMRPAPQILADIMEKLRGMGKEQRVAAAQTIFGTEAMSGMLALMDKSPAEFNKLVSALKNSKGAAAETAAEMKDNLKGSLMELQGAFETLQISVGGALAPAIRAIADALAVLVRWFNSLPAPVQSFLAISAAVVGVLLILGSLFAFAVAGLGSLALAFNTTIGVVAATIGWIVAIIAAIVALGAIFVYAYNKVGWFRDMVNQAWASIKAGFQAVVDFLRPAVQAVVDFVVQQWNKIKTWWSTNGSTISQAASNVWNFIKTVITTVMQVIWSIMQFIWPAILFVIQTIWESIKAVISSAINIILAIIGIFANLFTGNWSGLWENVKSLIVNALIFIWNFFQLWGWGKLVAGALKLGMGLLNIFKSGWTSIWQAVKSVLTSMWNGIKSAFDKIKSFIDDAWRVAGNITRSVWNGIKSFLSAAWNFLKSLVQSAFNGIKSVIQTVWNAVKSVTSSVWNGIKSWLSSTWNALKSKVTSAWNAIKSATSSAWNSVKSIISNVGSSIRSTLSGLASKALSWGRNLMDMFISGIKSKIRALVGAVSDVAGKVSDYLGFHSPTEKGPASDSHKWAPNFMRMFTQGMERNIPWIQRAAYRVAAAMRAVNVAAEAPQVSRAGVGALSVSRSGYVSPSARAEAQGGGVTVTGNTFYVREERDIDRIAIAIERRQRNKLRAQGRVTP
jgi:TP901 family phage tail tape measure protein